MAFDLYVGPLTRYFCHDFKCGAEVALGIPMKTITLGPDGPVLRRAVTDPDQVRHIRKIVQVWRASVAQRLAPELSGRLDWDETRAAPYEVQQIGWHRWGALQLFAAYDERPDLLPCEIRFGPDEFMNDPALREGMADRQSRYGHLHPPVGLWLPAAFRTPFDSADFVPGPLRVGSAHALLEALNRLNMRTWRVDPESAGTAVDQECSTEFERTALDGFLILHAIARFAVEHTQPIKLDY
jgi:hypothetical protein